MNLKSQSETITRDKSEGGRGSLVRRVSKYGRNFGFLLLTHQVAATAGFNKVKAWLAFKEAHRDRNSALKGSKSGNKEIS